MIAAANRRADKPGVAFRKLSADDRIDEIVDAVEAMIVRDHTLSFGMNQIATEIASSRTLIYVYFESVPQIVDEVCRRHLVALDEKLQAAGGGGDVVSRARALGRAYLDYLIERGPALRYILRDGEPAGPLERARPVLRGMLMRLMREAHRLLQFEPEEALVLIDLLSAIPDALARLLRDGQIAPAVAHATCDRLVADLVADLRVVR